MAALARKLKTGWQYARDVIEVIQRRHKPIAQYFCADMGIRLMNIDSRISMGATGAMVAKGIHVLPVHDSWVVPARHIDQAEARIQEQSRWFFPRLFLFLSRIGSWWWSPADGCVILKGDLGVR